MAAVSGDQKVQLGCGTLIVIAIIVMFFSQGSSKDVEREVRGLRSDVGDLKKLIESQNSELQQLRERLPAPVVPKENGKGK
jgi:hypothetical protein